MNHLSDWENKVNSAKTQEIIEIYFPSFNDSYDHANLVSLERFLINNYESANSVPKVLRDNLEIFISRGLKESFGGKFIDLSNLSPDANGMIGISYASLDHIDVCSTLVNLPFTLKTGEYWVSLFETNEKLIASSQG